MSGGFNPVNLAIQASLAISTGGTSLLVQAAAQQLMQSIGQELIGQLGQAMGVPQDVVSLAQGMIGGNGSSLGAAVSAFGDMSGLSSTQQGSMQNEIESMISDFVQQNARNDGSDGSGKDSWLVALAKALGKVADHQADQLQSDANQLTGKDDKPSDVYKVQGESQEFGLMMNAFTDIIKTIGQAMGQTASKN